MKKLQLSINRGFLLLLLLSIELSAFANHSDDKHKYYSKAVAHAVPSSVGKVWVGVSRDGENGKDSRKWSNPGTADTYDWTEAEEKSAPTYSYHYYKQDPDKGYTFKGWYKNSTCTSQKTADAEFSENVTATEDENKVNLEYWAYWTANKYTIAFNGNGSTSGSTESVNATYDVDATLTSNGFGRTKYTVNFNADGGSCGTSSTQINYGFAGWAETSTGSVKYANGATVKNLTATNNATVTLYAKWNNPASETITLPNATNDGYVMEGWYDGSTKVGEAGNNYAVTKNVTLKAHWAQRFDFTMSGANSTLSVDEQQATAFNFVHASNPTPHITVTSIDPINNGNGKVIEYDAANNKIIAHNAGTATIYFTQAETSTIKSGTSATYTYTVNKIANTLDVTTTTHEMFVDDELGGIINNGVAIKNRNNTDVAVSVTSTDEKLLHYVAGEDKVEAPNKDKEMFGVSKKVTLTFSQPETYKYTAASKTIEVIVKKHANTIKVKNSTSYSSSIYVDSYDNGLTLTADNTDYTNCPITNTQTAGTDIATFYQKDKVVYSSYKLGTATWTLSQPENYKYQAGSGSFTVEVVQQPAEECNVLKNDAEYKFNEMNDNTYVFDAPGDKVTFQIKKYSGATLNQDPVLKGYDVTTGKWVKLHDMSFTTSWEWKTYPINNTNIRKIKWDSDGENSWKYIRFVSITRKTYLNIATDNGNNGTLTINKKSDGYPINPGQTGVADSKIYWSCAGGGNLKIACDNPHFSFSTKEITGTDCNNGTTDITVSYTNTEAGTETATVTVYNQMYRQTFTVKGVIEKADQLITWNNDILRVGQSYTDVATANTLVTYESEDESIIRVDEDDEGHKTILTAVGTGTVNITATAEESSFYAEKSDTKSIKVTEKQIQWIDWNQSLFGLKLGGANVTMNAVAASDVEGCVSSRLIEYSSSDKSVVKVVNNNQLQIIGVGTAIITAVQAGGFDSDGHEYERAETEKTVIVRDPNAPCESFAYQQGQEVKMDCGWNALDKQTRTSEINFNGIIPAKGTLRYKGEKKTVWPVDYFDGTMSVEQYIPGENWQPVTGGDLGKPTVNEYKTANLTFDRRATKMRVKVTDGLGYHYFTDCQVTQARFIETTAPTDFSVSVGQQQSQAITLSYSNITDGLSLTLAQGANSHFSVDKTYIEGTCGDAAKNVKLTVTYHPTAEETNAQDVLTITDGTTSCQVVLTGSATRVNRHINWDHADEIDIYTVQTETLSAEARTDLNELAGVVTFSLASSSTATGAISMENVLSFTSAGVAKVVAYTTDDARYNAAPNVTKVFNVSKTPTTISTLPVLAAVTSGAAIGEIELNGWQATNTINGGVVEGTLEITSVDLTNAGTNTVTLTFTPSNTDMYVGCTSTTTIVVNKATSVATPSAANIVYGQKVSASLLSNEGTEGTWAWNTGNNEAVLDAGTHEGLAVHFTPASGNYTELDATVTLTVTQADAEATPAITAITYGQKVSEAALTNTGATDGVWALVSVDADEVKNAGSYELNVHFTPTNSNYKEKDATVTLTVNKAASEATPSAAAIKEGQKVSESVLTNSGTAGTWVWDAAVADNTPAAGTYNYTVHFTPENSNYTTLTTTVQLQVNALVYNFTNNKGDGDWSNPENWENGVVPASDPDVIVSGDLQIDEDMTVGSLTIQETGSVSVISDGTLTVTGVSDDREKYGDIHVKETGNLVLGNTAALKVNDFILDASLGDSEHKGASGQVSGEDALTINGDAYFQMDFDPSGKISFGWYDFTVPFEVDVQNGIYRLEKNGTKTLLRSGVDFIIQTYSEAKRAAGNKSWSNFSGTMQPGYVYTITLDDDVEQNTILFKRKANASIGDNSRFAAQCSSGKDKDKGWNGLGNGTLQHAQLAKDVKIQVYDHFTNSYRQREAKDYTFAIGTSFFVQVPDAQTIVFNPETSNRPLLAPSYNPIEVDEFELSLTAEGATHESDRMWVSASEETTGEYTIGHDLLKMGTPTSAKVAQMWAEAYSGLKLCDIEMQLKGSDAQTVLCFYAPQTGTYILSADEAPANTSLYLTYNGRVIWNLSYNPYTLDLTKGTTEGYGLKLYVNRITTDIEEVQGDGAQCTKVLMDNKIYIIMPNGVMYDATGKKVQ